MNKTKTKLLIVTLILAFLAALGVSYAYFSARILGLENASTINLIAGKMQINYSEDSNQINLSGIYPRREEWATKTITITGLNTTALDMNYELGFNIENNTFKGGQLTFSLTGEGSNGTLIENIEKKAIVKPSGYMKIGVGTFKKSNNETHTYTLKIYFKNLDRDQNINQKAVFNGKVTIKDRDAEIAKLQDKIKARINTTNQNHTEKYCQTDDYVEGTTPTNNQVFEPANSIYKYTYSTISGGWAVSLKDATSTESISEGPCTYVNNVVVNSMASLFKDSQSTSIDLSNFNTSHIINMASMFQNSRAIEIVGLNSFDTSAVLDMNNIFNNSKASNLILNSFDTSKVKSMEGMFSASKAKIIDISSFDTSSVNTMKRMFYAIQSSSIDLSSFNTSNVIDMSNMFSHSQITRLDLNSFDTSKVIDMSSMFYNSLATEILGLNIIDTYNVKNMRFMFALNKSNFLDLSSFDTSSVTTMEGMFDAIQSSSIDLSSFNTSNVIDMNRMFDSSQTTILDLTTFDTSKVTNMSGMFQNSQTTTLDLSSFDTSKVTNIYNMFYQTKASIGYARTQSDADRFNNVAGSLSNGENPNTSIPNTLRFTVK